MSNFFETWENESEEHKKLVAQERLILEVTESIYEEMLAKGINRVQLAERMGKSKAYVSQLLSGSRNMTLRSLADISFALDVANPSLNFADIDYDESNGDWVASGNVVSMMNYRATAQSVGTDEADADGWMSAVR